MLSSHAFAQALHNIVLGDASRYSLESPFLARASLGRVSAPAGSTVLVRADVDLGVVDGKVVDLSRVYACQETLSYCLERKWKVVIFGHFGRSGVSIDPVRAAFAHELKREIVLVEDWLDESHGRLTDLFVESVEAAPSGTLFMLENTRKYSIEQALWKATEEDFPGIANSMYSVVGDIRNRLTRVFINEAIAASNLDFSSCAVPLLMDEVALGLFLQRELSHLIEASAAEIVITSGLKANKLDDLERIVERGRVRLILVAGALAMSLVKASAERAGRAVSIGRAELDDTEPFFVPRDRITQAIRILSLCEAQGIDVLLPTDFILEDGRVVSEIPPESAQQDIGPATVASFESKLLDYVASHSRVNLYVNGVAGRFEDPRFQEGTRALVALLERISKMGARVYVGGGEGRKALFELGNPEKITHAFTAGGTVLKAVSGRQPGFLAAIEEQVRTRENSLNILDAAIESLRKSQDPDLIEDLADQLGKSEHPQAVDVLLSRLSDAQVQEYPDVEDAVCQALVRLRVMDKRGNLNFQFKEASLLDSAGKAAIEKYAPTLPVKYFANHRS